MNGKNNETGEAWTLDLDTRHNTVNGVVSGLNRLDSSTPTRPRASSTPGSFWKKFQVSKKNTKPVKTPSLMEASPTTGECTVYPIEDATSSKPAVLLPPEAFRSLAKEAASTVLMKSLAKTPKTTGSSSTALLETNRTRLLETGTTEVAEDVVNAPQSTGDISTGEEAMASWGEEAAAGANDTDRDWYYDDDDGGGGDGSSDGCVRPRPRLSGHSATTTDGGYSGWSSSSPSRRRHVSDGPQQQQHHHHYHYHHDHQHRKWHSSSSLSLPGRSTTPSKPRDTHGDEPSTHASNEYHHHHHHHHYHHHYYYFRGRPQQGLPARPVSLVFPAEDIEKKDKCENSDTYSMSIPFQDTPRKTPSTLFRSMFSHLGSNGKVKSKRKNFASLSRRSSKDIVDSQEHLKIDEDTPKHVDNTLENTMIELVKTEKEYVANLSLVVKGYMAVMEDPVTENCSIPVPEDLKINSEKYKLIFINIKSMYEWHRDVCLPALERSCDEPQELNGLLQKRDDLLKMYIDYHKNIHHSEHLVYEFEIYFEEMRNFLGHNLHLSSIMVKPLQRIMKLNDLLKDIYKTVEHRKLNMNLKIIQETIDDLNKFILDFGENSDEEACRKARKKLNSAIHELITTEEGYINALGLVVNGYMPMINNPKAKGCKIPIPVDFHSNSSLSKLVFVNIKEIYEWHRKVCLPAIKKCFSQPQELEKLFKKLHSQKDLYSTYFQKKSISSILVVKYEHYFEDMHQFLGHALKISDILIKPVQRIFGYDLLLNKILAYMVQLRMHDQAKYIENSISILSDLKSQLNEIIIIDRVHNFDGNISTQGQLLVHGVLKCAEKCSAVNQVKVDFKELYVFLFDKIMIFTVEVTDKYHPRKPLYYYKDHILLNKMELDEEQYNPMDGSFIIKSTDSSRSPMQEYICHPVVTNVTTEDLRFKWFEHLHRLQEAQITLEGLLTDPLGSHQRTQMT